MLTDIAIKSLKSIDKPYKVPDRAGLCVSVAPTGTRTFCYDYRVNGRRETLTIGRHGKYGITLAVAREKLIDAKKRVDEGVSPAKEKKRAKAKAKSEGTFGELAGRWLAESEMSDSTRDMRRHIVDRDLIPASGNHTLREATSEDVRQRCDKIMKRGAPSTAPSASLSGPLRARCYESRFDGFASLPFLSFFPLAGTQAAIIKGQLPTDIEETKVDASLLWQGGAPGLQHMLLVGAIFDGVDYLVGSGFDFASIGVMDYTVGPQGLSLGTIPAISVLVAVAGLVILGFRVRRTIAVIRRRKASES